MSGTSLDGLDIALVDFSGNQPVLRASELVSYPDTLSQQLTTLCQSESVNFQLLGSTDALLGDFFSKAVLQFLSSNNVDHRQVMAIGSHGQTIHHQPSGDTPFTLQIGDANRLAEKTGIPVVADFRRKDMAAGGQGAPLVPAFHADCFQDEKQNRAIINIGGIANITFLPSGHTQHPLGFDSGPGNTLMNQFCQAFYNQPYDHDALIASSGTVNSELLAAMLNDDYFQQAPPKSTGPEHFSFSWLDSHRTKHPATNEDTLATLCRLSAQSILDALNTLPTCSEIYICGGGAHNPLLMKTLRVSFNGSVYTTSKLGIDPDWVEAMAFAWLAKQTVEGLPGNIPSVTGAKKSVVLGAIYPA